MPPADLDAALKDVHRVLLDSSTLAVIVASGLLAGCEAIVCSDQQWVGRLGTLFPQFRWIYLGRHSA